MAVNIGGYLLFIGHLQFLTPDHSKISNIKFTKLMLRLRLFNLGLLFI